MASNSTKKFKRILQTEFNLSDNVWSYKINNLPDDGVAGNNGYVKSIELTSGSDLRKLELQYVKVEPNRAITTEPLKNFLHISFAKFRLGELREQEWIPATARESAKYLENLLTDGITINGILYSFYGHSSSQLKSRSCYLIRGTKKSASEKVESLGDFSKMKTVAKQAKRIGLLFSSCHAVLDVPEGKYQDIDDVERDGFTFTDGCGLISRDFMKRLAKQMPIIVRNNRYYPSVFQIRFRGYKGVVMLHTKMEPGCWLQFRKSMRKFTGTTDPSFAVVEYSKPYTFGYLNDDIVLLLHSLGVTAETLLRKQAEHFEFLRRSLNDSDAAYRLLCSLGQLELAERLMMKGIESIYDSMRSLISKECEKMLNKRETQKCRIFVPSSRLVFGVCDPLGVLKPGECFVRVTSDEGRGLPITISNVEVLVTRNPCLHPGDLRKLKAVNRPELAHLSDCIVFSVQGKRPAADQMSGGDLDGDTFFVCWDPDLVPSSLSQVAEYPAGREPINFHAITADDRIHYLAHYTSASLGRVKKLFLEWAVVNGPLSPECQELNRLHSLCVDGNRVKVPPKLEQIPKATQERLDGFILNILHSAAVEHCKQMLAKRSQSLITDSRELVETILSDTRNMAEFEMMKLVFKWCAMSKGSRVFADFLPYFDISVLSDEQRHWLLQQLPPTFTNASLVKNELVSSSIITSAELAPFHLDYPGMHWKCVYRSEEHRIANLFERMEVSFNQFHRKLLVFKVHDRLSIAAYIPTLIPHEEDVLVGSRIRLLAFPHSHKDRAGHRRIITPGPEYKIYYDQSRLDIFDRQKSNTFIWMGRAANDEASYRHIKGRADRAREREKTISSGVNHDWVTSIALDKFSRNIQTQIGRVRRDGVTSAEIYVISNKDLASFRVLDLWLESIDTNQKIPNFERNPPPLILTKLKDIDLSERYPALISYLETRDPSWLDDVHVRDRIVEALKLCFEHHERDLPVQIYRHYLNKDFFNVPDLHSEGLLLNLLHCLPLHPETVLFFAKMCPFEESLGSNLGQCLRKKFDTIWNAVLVTANKMEDFTLPVIRDILIEAGEVTPEVYSNICEQICLLIRDPKMVTEIFFDILEPLSSRLLNEPQYLIEYFSRNLFGILLEHSDEAHDQGRQSASKELWKFDTADIYMDNLILRSERRIDAPQMERLAVGDHIRFTLAEFPENMALPNRPVFDTLVETAELGAYKFRCLSKPPSYYEQARWRMRHCGSFTTSRAMIDSLLSLVEMKSDLCAMYPLIVGASGVETDETSEDIDSSFIKREDLNDSQNEAVIASVVSPMTCIWGPPGTGKTHTIVAILQELLERFPDLRVLVTAPTHNAVDNVLRKYLSRPSQKMVKPIRVSTDVRKVAEDLRDYTCDAMEGKDINQFPAARKQAIKRIKEARLVFTTCAGAGLGLLRDEVFPIAIIDEASQQSEPMSLIPLVKGCRKAIIVGDHVQLRATVRTHSRLADFEISLFERLYNSEIHESSGLRKVMLDVQYRMHPQISQFPASEFYMGKLRTAERCHNIPMPPNMFPWPQTPGDNGLELARAVLVPCGEPEEFGQRSKGNPAQAKLCKEIFKLLRTLPEAYKDKEKTKPSIAVLTPYTRQVKLLEGILPSSTKISSIDGFQGQEADFIIYVSVRCNLNGDMGFLDDMRRLNVALTRAKAGLIVIGDQRTLTWIPIRRANGDLPLITDENTNAESPAQQFSSDVSSKQTWKRFLDTLAVVDIQIQY